MNNNISKELVKRIKSDATITNFIAFIAAGTSFMYLVRFITSILAQNFESNNIQSYAANCVEIGFAATALIILGNVLREICKTGKPFTASITKKFRIIAILR